MGNEVFKRYVAGGPFGTEIAKAAVALTATQYRHKAQPEERESSHPKRFGFRSVPKTGQNYGWEIRWRSKNSQRCPSTLVDLWRLPALSSVYRLPLSPVFNLFRTKSACSWSLSRSDADCLKRDS